MTTPQHPTPNALFSRMETHGFDPEKDQELFEWADHWAFSNQFMKLSDDEFFDLFMDSYGVSMYVNYGIVPESDD